MQQQLSIDPARNYALALTGQHIVTILNSLQEIPHKFSRDPIDRLYSELARIEQEAQDVAVVEKE